MGQGGELAGDAVGAHRLLDVVAPGARPGQAGVEAIGLAELEADVAGGRRSVAFVTPPGQRPRTRASPRLSPVRWPPASRFRIVTYFRLTFSTPFACPVGEARGKRTIS